MKRIVAFITTLVLATPVFAVPAPKASIATFAQLNPPAAPYDVAANVNAAVKAAFAAARRSHKRVLIDLGGNRCGDCRILAGLMDLPKMHRFLTAHFEVVSVDVGRFDTNLQIPARFGFTKQPLGMPTVLIATAQGEMINGTDVFALADARYMEPQAVAAWLAKWAR